MELTMNRNQILKIYGTDYKEMTKRLLASAELDRHLLRAASQKAGKGFSSGDRAAGVVSRAVSLRRIRRRSGSRSSPILSAPLPLHLEEPRTRRSSPASSSICGSTAILISGSSKAPGSATKHRTLSNTAATASLPNITMSLSLTGRKRNLTRSMRPAWNCMSLTRWMKSTF